MPWPSGSRLSCWTAKPVPSVLTYILVAVVYLAGAYAAAESGWVATVRFLKMRPGLGRALAIAASEAFIGLGTGVLAVVLGAWLMPDRVLTLTVAAIVGVTMGAVRQLRAFRTQADGYREQDESVGNPASARSLLIAEALLREVQYGVAARLVGAVAVLIGVGVEAFSRAAG